MRNLFGDIECFATARAKAKKLRLPLKARASVFAALGDETRLSVLAKLANGEAQSISRLTGSAKLTRQAVTKHLRVLEGAGVVRCARVGRESQFALRARLQAVG